MRASIHFQDAFYNYYTNNLCSFFSLTNSFMNLISQMQRIITSIFEMSIFRKI